MQTIAKQNGLGNFGVVLRYIEHVESISDILRTTHCSFQSPKHSNRPKMHEILVKNVLLELAESQLKMVQGPLLF